MGHTIAPGIGGYTLYTPSSSDNLSSRSLHKTWTVRQSRKADVGASTKRTPFMAAPGTKAIQLPGFVKYRRGGARNMYVCAVLAVPPASSPVGGAQWVAVVGAVSSILACVNSAHCGQCVAVWQCATPTCAPAACRWHVPSHRWCPSCNTPAVQRTRRLSCGSARLQLHDPRLTRSVCLRFARAPNTWAGTSLCCHPSPHTPCATRPTWTRATEIHAASSPC